MPYPPAFPRRAARGNILVDLTLGKQPHLHGRDDADTIPKTSGELCDGDAADDLMRRSAELAEHVAEHAKRRPVCRESRRLWRRRYPPPALDRMDAVPPPHRPFESPAVEQDHREQDPANGLPRRCRRGRSHKRIPLRAEVVLARRATGKNETGRLHLRVAAKRRSPQLF